ncbi:hypothetical protein [Rariglobus hedericola]|uniref:Dicarboxylate transport domain-containing protein n=1 Tax=Rariglobus hedericola TaxID=2597822 RepID=A0A556QQP0_9BACT|nr:hypothetical protein [Rariglobus hedericola]TSJ78939.1 hypothetical protein FPL22_06455 [Rariglobus hedericola]
MRVAAAFVFVVLSWFAGATAVQGAGLVEMAPWLTRFTGGLKGVYTPVEGRALAWSLTWSGDDGAVRSGEIKVAGPDMMLRVALKFHAADNRLVWRVTEGRVDLAAWLPALAARPELAALDGTTVTGALEITGEGDLIGSVPTGTLSIDWREGTARNDTQGWSLAGVTLHAGGEVAALAKGNVPLELKVGTISTARFGARALRMSAMLIDFTRADVAAAEVEIAGGKVITQPFGVELKEPRLAVDISMIKVGLQDIAALVPDFLADGRGRVNGAVRLNWSQRDGVSVGLGHISIDPEERAEVRFRPNPGLLTGSLPPAILKYYPGLTNVEMGQASLLAERFDVRFSPEGDAEGRTATVNIAGGPVDTSLKAPLVLTINVRGPLAPLLKFGSTPGLGLSGAK